VKEKIQMIVFVLVLGAAWTTALVGVEHFTAPIIEKYRAGVLRMSVLGTLGIPYTEAELDTVFTENIEVLEIEVPEKGGRKVYRTRSGEVAFQFSGAGSQGPISGVAALESDLASIKAIVVTDQTETPGLGDRVLDEQNLAKFAGKRLKPELVIAGEGKASAENEVDGVTGATLTCKALEKILNSEIGEVVSLLKEGTP
jgi:Na+-translocating ferredoxin:NAD+ oxidoreductase RnfG subunit